VSGRISKSGDAGVRTALHEAANVILTRTRKGSSLKKWAMGVAKRAGMRKAKVARRGTQVCEAAINRAARNPRRPRYRNDPAMSGRTRLTGRKQPPFSLVQNWLKRFEASLDGGDVSHSVRISAPAAKSRQFPDTFVAFLSALRFFSSESIVLAQALSVR
jgi:hypothetical protein